MTYNIVLPVLNCAMKSLGTQILEISLFLSTLRCSKKSYIFFLVALKGIGISPKFPPKERCSLIHDLVNFLKSFSISLPVLFKTSIPVPIISCIPVILLVDTYDNYGDVFFFNIVRK